MSTFQIFPNFGRGGGVIENQFFPKFKKVQNILGGGGQENYGLFPQFVTFFFDGSPYTSYNTSLGKQVIVHCKHLCFTWFNVFAAYIFDQTYQCYMNFHLN